SPNVLISSPAMASYPKLGFLALIAAPRKPSVNTFRSFHFFVPRGRPFFVGGSGRKTMSARIHKRRMTPIGDLRFRAKCIAASNRTLGGRALVSAANFRSSLLTDRLLEYTGFCRSISRDADHSPHRSSFRLA